jgi:mono/diheme cytochrome c family protein
MRRLIGFAVMTLFLLAVQMVGQEPPPRPRTDSLGHGKYLVDRVGLCGDCHTPHNENGQPIEGQWLQGAPITFKPLVPMPEWADKAPAIAGLPRWTKEGAIKFLMTGFSYNGLPARPPMPQFRLNHSDAEAVVEYLKSLSPAK